MEFKKGEYILNDDKSLLDYEKIYTLLKPTYWANQRKQPAIQKSIKNSLCFGLYIYGKQIGFARFITDKAVISWFGDFVIDEKYRSIGLGRWMIECMLLHPDLKGTKMILGTKDAHTLYEKFGFERTELMWADIK